MDQWDTKADTAIKHTTEGYPRKRSRFLDLVLEDYICIMG